MADANEMNEPTGDESRPTPADLPPMDRQVGGETVFFPRRPFRAAGPVGPPAIEGRLPDMEALRQAHGLSNR